MHHDSHIKEVDMIKMRTKFADNLEWRSFCDRLDYFLLSSQSEIPYDLRHEIIHSVHFDANQLVNEYNFSSASNLKYFIGIILPATAYPILTSAKEDGTKDWDSSLSIALEEDSLDNYLPISFVIRSLGIEDMFASTALMQSTS
jgi:hypothetical protein